jgi:hypothetical protein
MTDSFSSILTLDVAASPSFSDCNIMAFYGRSLQSCVRMILYYAVRSSGTSST